MYIRYKEWMTPAIVGVTSFAAGLGTGLFVNRYRYLKRIDNLETQVVGTQDHIQEVEIDVNQMQFQFDENIERMNSVVQQANRVILAFMEDVKNGFKEVVENIEESEPDEVNIIEEKVEEDVTVFNEYKEDGWDYEKELKTRGPDHPYIIHRDEFYSDEMDLTQSSLTYYAGDNILCDEKDVPIYNPEKIVGVLDFGHGSHDPNIVYVRNERLMAEYEIVLEPGYFQTEVLGQEIESHLKEDGLKHSILKFRDTD